MKLLFFVAAIAVSTPVFGCVDLSGTYINDDGSEFSWQQKGCESLTSYTCEDLNSDDGGQFCRPHVSYLDGVMRGKGDIGGASAHLVQDETILKTYEREQWVDRYCWYNILVYSKDVYGNLLVTLKLNCFKDGVPTSRDQTHRWSRKRSSLELNG